MLKVSNSNRGRGIHVFSTLSRLNQLLREATSPNDTHYVLQKYIERPLLVHGRKFDLRVWVLVTCDMKVYFYKEGYVRTACTPYTV